MSVPINRTTEASRRSTWQSQMDVEVPKRHKALFMDMKEMKQKLRQNLHKPRYNVFDFYYKEGLCQWVARAPMFENITLAVISLNAMWLAVDTEANTAEVLVEAQPVFIVVENLFCGYFTVELCTRWGAFSNKLNCFKDAWFCFDSALVSLMIFETWVMSAMILMSGAGSQGGGVGNAGVLRLMRLMRLTKMARMARLLRCMPELLILIKGMVAAARAVFVTLLLLMVILYVFGIAFRQLTDDTLLGELFFPGVLSAMHSLVIFGIMFDDVADMMIVMEEASAYHMIILFYFFILLATLTVLNMLIGVLCEVISNVASVEQEQIQVHYLADHLRPIVKRCCGVEDLGALKISRQQFLDILCDDQCTPLLDMVSVDSFSLVDLVDTLFTTPQGLPCKLTYDSFVGTILDQRMCNTATVKELTSVRKWLKATFDRIDFDNMARVFAMGSLCERGLGLPPGTYQKKVAEARKKLVKVYQNPKGVSRQTIESRVTIQSHLTIARQTIDDSLAASGAKRKGAAALLKGLRSGEVGKLVDVMEEEAPLLEALDEAPAEAEGQAQELPPSAEVDTGPTEGDWTSRNIKMKGSAKSKEKVAPKAGRWKNKADKALLQPEASDSSAPVQATSDSPKQLNAPQLLPPQSKEDIAAKLQKGSPSKPTLVTPKKQVRDPISPCPPPLPAALPSGMEDPCASGNQNTAGAGQTSKKKFQMKKRAPKKGTEGQQEQASE